MAESSGKLVDDRPGRQWIVNGRRIINNHVLTRYKCLLPVGERRTMPQFLDEGTETQMRRARSKRPGESQTLKNKPAFKWPDPVELLTEFGGTIAISSVMFIALVLRIWGHSYGLPHLFHPDEWAIVDRAMNMLRTGDYNPKNFGYPSFFMYNEAVIFALRFFYGVIKAQYDNFGQVQMEGIYSWGRMLTALYGAANVFIIYKAGNKLFGRASGIIGALFLAVGFLHVRDSHYITVDVPATTLATLSFLFACGILKTGEWKYYVLSGLAAGLATATKWNVAPILFCLLTAHFITYIRREPINGRLFAGIGSFIAGLYIGTPYAFKDPGSSLNSIADIFVHYRGGHPGYEAASPVMYYLQNIFSAEGISLTIAAAAVLGLIISLVMHRSKDFFLVVFPVIYILTIARSNATFPRTALPLYPFIAIYAGLAAVTCGQWLSKRFTLNNIYQHAVLAALAILIALPSAARAVQFDIGSSVISTRAAGGAWISQNIPKGSKIAAEFYAPPIEGEYEVVRIPFLDHDPSWFRNEGFDYLVFDGADFQRFYDEPGKYKKEVGQYDGLFALGKVIKDFPADKRVELFLSPEIRIVRMGR